MYYVIKYQHKNSYGGIKLRIPDSDLSKDRYREQLEMFVTTLNEFNKYFHKRHIKTSRSIENEHVE